MRARRIALAILALASAAAPLGAQPGEADAKERARQHFERGNELLAEGAVDAALAELQRSRALFPTRGNTQNSAVALARLGRYVEALETYRSLLAEFTLEPDERALVEREIEILDGLVGEITVRTEPGASVSVDGRERGTTPLAGPLPVSAGTRTIRVSKPGRLPFERRIDIAGGQSITIDAALPELVERVERIKEGPVKVVTAPAAEPESGPMLAALAGMAIGPGLGGPLAEHCSGSCDAKLATGASLAARAGWHFGSGVELGAELGFLRVSAGYDNRRDFLEPVGSGEQQGVADDDLTFQGFSVGAFASYSRGERWTWRLGLGGGALFARITDARTGSYDVTPVSGAPYTADLELEQTRSGSYAYVSPEAFFGYRIFEKIEIGASLGSLLLFGINPAQFERDAPELVRDAAGNDQFAYLRGDELTGTPVFLLLPRLGVFGRL